MSQSPTLPRSVLALTATLAGAGVATAGIDLARTGAGANDWAWLGPLAALLVVGAFIQIRFRYRDEIEALDLFEAAMAPMLFAFAGWVVVAVVLLANLVESVLHRNQPVKAAFNIAQWMAAAGSGALVLSVLRQGPDLSWHNVGALCAALGVMLVVNHLAFAAVIALAQQQSLREVAEGLRNLIVPGWVIGGGLNLAFGMLFVAAYQWKPAVVFLFFVPLLALNWAQKGYAEARADRARVASLHRATLALASSIDPIHAIGRFLAEVRECFESEVVELVLAGPDGRTVHRLSDGDEQTYSVEIQPNEQHSLASLLLARGQAARVAVGYAEPAAAALLDAEGWRNCVASPLVHGTDVIGVLCTYNRTGFDGFEEGELAVLGALADDVVTAIEKSRLVQEVLDERQKLADIVGNTSDGILTLAADGTVTSWNPALETITGWRASELIGTTQVATLRPRDESDGDVLIEHWARPGVHLPAEVQIHTRAGEARWLSCSYTRVEESASGPASLIVVARDVTTAKELERLKEDFVATVSHELRTPLAPIKGWATTLLEHGERINEDQRREAMESILRHSQRLERLIVNLLEASKIEHGRTVDVDEEIDVSPVVGRVVDTFRAGAPDRLFVLNGLETPSPARGNELWVEQILTNLVSNALKYSPPSTPIEVAVTHRSTGVEVAVTDYGQGIPDYELERIFDRFHRLQQTETQTGTGLGLWIARQLAGEIGGTITVQSTEGIGSRFALKLRGLSHLAAVS
ncbi:MAG: PAS domain S-box protein [Actinobacteria bacterium]|nr:PAS domain S-box protein [Actinomycetota bacterium]MBV9666151.1 PAS domain S-box protein [Actinomycetota bacterium]MBV9933411.1 PAS domain S-box protein [Actinomycetota bacterium]